MDTRGTRCFAQLVADDGGLAMEMLGQLAQRVSFEFGGQIAPLGFTPAQFAVIDFLFTNGGSVIQADIARCVGVEQPTLAVTLRRMERPR